MTIKRCYPTIIGASVGENQLVKELSATNFEYGSITSVVWNNNTATVTVSSSAVGGFYGKVATQFGTAGHKYLISVTLNSQQVRRFKFGFDNLSTFIVTSSANNEETFVKIQEATRTSSMVAYRYTGSDASAGDTFTVKNYMAIDLTLLLGSSIADYAYTLEQATAGSGLAWLRSYGFLTDGYVPYNAGSIESVEVTEKVVTGFNQWDEEWELGTYSSTNGQKYNSSSNIRCKNYIPVIGGATYYIKGNYSVGCCYDADKKYIGTIPWRYSGITGQYYLDMPSNASYIRFCMTNSYGTTYNHDICINISSDRNGEYEPYKSTTYSLGSDVLRGIFKLSNGAIYADGDRKESDGTITRRYGIVDLGTLTWNVRNPSSGEYRRFNATVPNMKAHTSVADTANGIVCSKYVASSTVITTITVDKAMARYSGGIYITDSAYSDAASFKTAMNGVYLVYELATPTTETSTPFTSTQICYPDGTEEFVTENGVPVGHESKYQL